MTTTKTKPQPIWTPTQTTDNPVGVAREPATRTREHESANVKSLPFISVLCVTFNRPHLLPNVIGCFIAQDYPSTRCELIVLDDCGQYPSQPTGPNWRVISFPKRFDTLSAKRNAVAALVDPRCDALTYWDDDDSWAPWCLMSHARALEHHSVSHPSHVLGSVKSVYRVTATGNQYQATQCIDRQLFTDVGGYPRGNSGVDQMLTKRLLRSIGEFGNPCAPDGDGFPPWFVYGWDDTNSPHLSTHGADGYHTQKFWDSWQTGRTEQHADIIPKQRKRWGVELRTFFGIPVEMSTHDLPAWWVTNAYRFIS